MPKSLEELRKQIRDPGKEFRLAQQDIGERFKTLRPEVIALESQSIQRSVKDFIGELAIVVKQDAFFTGWQGCQLQRKPVVREEIKNFLDGAEATFLDAEKEILLTKAAATARIPKEKRVESFLFLERFLAPLSVGPVDARQAGAQSDDIPSFVPLRPFWAVFSYAGQLPGYIALQLALDFSPAILGLLFALLAPFPSGKTRLGAWAEDKIAAAQAWRQQRNDATQTSPMKSHDRSAASGFENSALSRPVVENVDGQARRPPTDELPDPTEPSGARL